MNINFWFRESKAKLGHGSLVCVVNIDGDESTPYSTGIIIPRKNWNTKEKCFEGKNSSKHEKTLRLLCKRLEEIKDEIESESPNALVSANEVIRRHRQETKRENVLRKKKSLLFRDCLREYMKLREILVENNRITLSTYHVSESKVKVLMEYLLSKQLERIKPHEITQSFMQKMKEDFIQSGYSDSTIAKYESFIKSVLITARKKELIDFSSLQDYRIETPPEKDPIYPTKRELDRMIAEAHSNTKYTKTMEIYLFCCLTSLSIGDYLSLCEDDFGIDDDGTLWICKERGKTHTWQRIPLNEQVMKLIEKYKTNNKTCVKLPIREKGKPVFLDLPKMTNQKLNEYLKEITTKANIKKDLTFHSSRRFQVDYIINELKIDSLIAREIIGWESDRQFKIYTKIHKNTIKSHFMKS